MLQATNAKIYLGLNLLFSTLALKTGTYGQHETDVPCKGFPMRSLFPAKPKPSNSTESGLHEFLLTEFVHDQYII